jgi:prephenate dehydrogenase
MPYLLAAALAHTKERYGAQDSLVEALAASGFRDTSRLAASEPDMMLDILLTNAEAVRASLRLFAQQLITMRELLDRPDDLRAWMHEAQAARRKTFR